MKQTLNTHDIVNALRKDTDAAWSYEGAKAMAEYLEEYEADSGEELELDVCAIRCDFSEHSSLYEWADDYFAGDAWMDAVGFDKDEDPDEDERDEAIREYIENKGILIGFSGGIIVSSF